MKLTEYQVRLLLRNGADVGLQDCKGLRAEEWARRCGHGMVLKMLREHRERRVD